MFFVSNKYHNNEDSYFSTLKFELVLCFVQLLVYYFLHCDIHIFIFFAQCNLQYTANETIGVYAVALQIEDFASTTDTVPLSSIPLQFVIEVFNSTAPCGSYQPEILGGTRCVEVSSTYQERIVAQSGGSNIRFAQFHFLPVAKLTDGGSYHIG